MRLRSHLAVIAGSLLLAQAFPAHAISLDKLRINGFVDMEYEESNHQTLGDNKGSFDQVHFNLLTDYQVSDTLTAKLHVEYEHSPNLPDSGEFKLDWSYLEFAALNKTRVRAGKVLTPFGLYNEIHDATPTYNSIRVPWSIFKASSIGGHDMFPKWSTGIGVLGDHALPSGQALDYVVYIANGENDAKNDAEEDENENKAIGGRLRAQLLPDMIIGVSAYNGDKGVAATDHTAWGVSAEYHPFPWGLRAEYASSELGAVTEHGWYVEGFYVIHRWTPYLRYGALDPDDAVANDTWAELVAGVDYELQPNVVLKLENRAFSGNPANAAVFEDYNEIAAAVSVAF